MAGSELCHTVIFIFIQVQNIFCPLAPIEAYGDPPESLMISITLAFSKIKPLS